MANNSLTPRQQDIIDAQYEGDTERVEWLRELERLGIENAPRPDVCPKCGAGLEEASGYAGETIAYCPNGCGIHWEDQEGAIRGAM